MPFDYRHRLANAARLGLVVGALAAAGAAESAGSQRLSIGAIVVHGGSCSFTSPGALSSKAETKEAVAIPYRCNGGAATTVSWSATSANAGQAGPAVTVTNTVTTVDLQRTDKYGDTVVLTVTP